MATLIQIRRDTQANWTTNNPVLALGEMAYSTDEQKLKVGDGSSAWSALDYINALPSEITAEINSAIDSVIDAAPGTLDTLNELAAAINDDASFYTTITNSISSSIDALDTDAIEEGVTNLYFTDARAQSALSGLYDPAGSASTAESNANTYTDGEISTLDASLKTYADTAESDAITSANAYTDGRETAITAAYESYADQAEADAISTAAADATTKANTAEANANTYTDGEISTLDTSLKSYADTAEADAIATAATDASSKADTAESNAKSYSDDLVGDVTVDGTLGNTVTDRIASAVADLVDSAPGTLDTLNELAAALGDDPNFATSIATTISTGDSNTLSSAQSYADQAEADAISTASADATAKADAALASAQTYADTAEADAIATANAYTDTRETAITTAYQSYADTAEADAISTAAADATTKANTAESNANAYTDGEISTLDTSLKAYADTAESDAIASAATDATTKANTAESNANTYTDNSINALDTDAIEEGASNLYFTNSRAQDATPGRVTASLTKPGTPSNGDGWVDINTGSLYVYINDGDSSQWVQV